jgi:hypothetical protein
MQEVAALREQLRAETTLTKERFESSERAINAALAAAKEANLKSEVSTEKRFEGVNEFRGQLKDQAATFITRAELWAWMVAMIGIAVGVVVLVRHW